MATIPSDWPQLPLESPPPTPPLVLTLLSATIDNSSGSRVVMFNPVVANLPHLFSLLTFSLSLPLSSLCFLFSFLQFSLSLRESPSILPFFSPAAVRPDHQIVHHSYPARSFRSSRMSNAGARFGGRRFGFAFSFRAVARRWRLKKRFFFAEFYIYILQNTRKLIFQYGKFIPY